MLLLPASPDSRLNFRINSGADERLQYEGAKLLHKHGGLDLIGMALDV